MARTRFRLVLLILLAGAVYLIGNGSTQLLDRDEPRYAQCSRQMVQSGDWVVPRLYDKIRAAKPPGIYWCQATAMEIFGDNAFAARFPSAVAMVLTLTLLGWAIWRESGCWHAIWACFILASSLLAIYCAKMSTTDSVLLLWTTVALMSIYLLWQGRGGWLVVISLSIAIAFAGLVKGPFILGVLGGTVGMLLILNVFPHRKHRLAFPLSLRETVGVSGFGETPLLPSHPGAPPEGDGVIAIPSRGMNLARAVAQTVVGLVIVAAIVCPWLYLVQHREPGFIRASTADAMSHMEHGSEGHWGPPGYHLALIWVTFLPWSILLPLAMVLGFRNRREPLVRFALAAALGTWIFVEILGTKLPHYILSAFPALSVLVADAVIRCVRGEQPDLEKRAFKIAGLATAIVILGLATVPWWWLAFRFHDFPWAVLASITCTGVAAAGIVAWLFLSSRPVAGLRAMGLGSLALGAVLFGIYLPNSRPLRISSRIAQILREQSAIHPGDVQMLDYKEPSLGFYQGGTIREADRFIPSVQYRPPVPKYLVLTRDLWSQAMPQQRATLPIVGEPVVGLNYSDSLRSVEVLVVRNELAH
jgi:4-amino-4-deoxy-L-arabinose transferase-like glycosyltransferase